MPDDTADRPFVLMASLLIADGKGDWEKAAESQRKLRDLGWFVSRKPPEQPQSPRRRRQKQALTPE